MSSLSSSETMCQLNECAQLPCQCLPLQTSEIGDTHVYFIRFMAPTLRSEPRELQNLHKNSTAGLSQKKGRLFWYSIVPLWTGGICVQDYCQTTHTHTHNSHGFGIAISVFLTLVINYGLHAKFTLSHSIE